MIHVDKQDVEDVLRLSSLPQHRLLAALGAIERTPELSSDAVGLTLSCSDSPDAVERFGCGDADEASRAQLAEEGRELFEAFLEERGDEVREFACPALTANKRGLADDTLMAAVALSVVADSLQIDQHDTRTLVLAALLHTDGIVLRLCGEPELPTAERTRPEQLS